METFSIPDMSNLTATAVLGWYAWHTVSKTIPTLVEAFRDELADLRGESRSEREALYHELAAERQQRHTDHLAIVTALNEVAKSISHSTRG